METLQEKTEAAIYVARSLFERNKVSGSSANMSFTHEGRVYITASGTSFGRLTPADFTAIDREGRVLEGRKPSKEYPLHLAAYAAHGDAGAVLHTHSRYATLWSCLEHENALDVLPPYTPYLRMKVGAVGLIPYAPPGSPELFAAFRERAALTGGYLLAHHGPVVCGKDILAAFYALEELEENAFIAWSLRGTDAKLIE